MKSISVSDPNHDWYCRDKIVVYDGPEYSSKEINDIYTYDKAGEGIILLL